MLSRRSASQAAEFSLTVTLNDDAINRATWDIRQLDLILDKKVQDYLKPLEPTPTFDLDGLSAKAAWDPALSLKAALGPTLKAGVFGPIRREETRSEEEFRVELDAWRENCRRELPLLFQDAAALARPPATFTITNTCGRFLEDVEMNVHIDGKVWAWDVPFNDAQPATRVPSPPRRWGPWNESPISLPRFAPNVPNLSPGLPRGGNWASFRNGGSVDVTLHCFELRPGATVEFDEDTAFICTDRNLEHTRITISATARGVHEQFKTEFIQPIASAQDLTPDVASILNQALQRE